MKINHYSHERPKYQDEKLYPWLSMLLDAYFEVDKGVFIAIESEREKGRKLACKEGCSCCCRTHKDIPVYPLELVGISWYVTERISGPRREALKEQLVNHEGSGSCPFLISSACVIHPVRPISCRQFNVFGSPCKDGEDPYYTRREDVMPPVKEDVGKAFFIMLPFYGVKKESERIKAVEGGAMHKMVKVMQTCNWRTLADKMSDFDKRNLKDR